MIQSLSIEALSIASARDSAQLATLLDTHFRPNKSQSLIVLPEYFIDGENLYDGAPADDSRINTLINYSSSHGAHIVAGMVERSNESKYITGLVISPTRGLIAARRKQTPTPFESRAGVQPGSEDLKVISLDNGLGKIAVAMCFEVFTLEKQLAELSGETDILINPRGFDLDDEKYGKLSDKWMLRNRNLAMMGKRFVIGATGSKGAKGAIAEIIDFEGDIINISEYPNDTVRATIDIAARNHYRTGKIRSHTVPYF